MTHDNLTARLVHNCIASEARNLRLFKSEVFYGFLDFSTIVGVGPGNTIRNIIIDEKLSS